NPKGITGFRDLLKPEMRVMVVSGAGQVGMWEDIAGRTGRIEMVRDFRRNIAVFAATSGDARRIWQENSQLDAWVIWNIWWVANPELADMVPIEDDLVIYRDSGVGLTRRGQGKPSAQQFVDFLQSPEGSKIFAKWGWLSQVRSTAPNPRLPGAQ
ncbi:MAG: substrate-binding domain-containing protein, partial [Actinomycetes bacterium]